MKKQITSVREAALNILIRVEQDKSYSNLLLNQMLANQSFHRADAALLTEIVYGTIQRLNTLDYFLARFMSPKITKLEHWVRNLLRLSLYQMLYLQRIPAHAIVNEAVNLAKKRGHQGISSLVNAVLRNALRNLAEMQIPSELPLVERLSLQYSHPVWLVARWLDQFGEQTTIQICTANNTPPKKSARVNLLKQTKAELINAMHQTGMEAIPSSLSSAGLVVENNGNLALTSWYKNGLLTVQDESSMLVAEILSPSPGSNVLDCCAAPGGKTTHLAEWMEDKGTIIACDIHPHKIKLIDEQIKRLDLHCIRTIVCNALSLSSRYDEGSFDFILLDAPCSGFGVIRRKPDLKWTKQEVEIADITELQSNLLDCVQLLLKPGGILVYSTCTLEYAENKGQIVQFLQRHPYFSLEPFPGNILSHMILDEGMLQILPHHFNSDGFFYARLRKMS